MKNLLLLILISLCSQHGIAKEIISTDRMQTNANPFVRIHGLPGYSGVTVLSPGQTLTRLESEVTNEFHQKTEGNEEVFFDYERTQLNLSLEYGITGDFSAGIVLPYISNSGGFMDGLIENWHDLFGLPQGGRDDAPRDQFMISYRNPEQALTLKDTDRGIGDITLFLDNQLVTSGQQALKVRASLKLPTGDDDQLFGSGGYAFAVSLNGTKQLTEKWQAYAMVGLSYLQDSDVLPELQENLVGSAVLGIGWQFRPRLGLSAQLDLNSEVYDGAAIDAINGQAGVLNISANYQFSENTILSFGFNEDVINKDASPDFGINLGFKYQY